MRNIADTIARLAAMRASPERFGGAHASDRLSDREAFGSNPGALRARTYFPATLKKRAPLVVVLHGCTQTAASYDHGSGWSRLADRSGFALLFPEQQRANNANLCFNWFQPEDNRRGGGEALSIRQMIAAASADGRIDPERIFVTGLSAGGAMASVMLATYPELFAGGAVIAGLPYGAANTVPEAFDRMRGHGLPSEGELQSLLASASNHRGRWPTISIWHGTGDRTVDPANADAVAAQWLGVHGLTERPTASQAEGRYSRTVWQAADGSERIESWRITGMGHGTPLDAAGAEPLGVPGPYMIDAGISSTWHIARFFGLAGTSAQRPAARDEVVQDGEAHRFAARPNGEQAGREETGAPASLPGGAIGKVIQDALRRAGLMR
ncbi:MAG: hypothetical protein K0S21_2309 [Rhizobiaceae bacterium]|nr:hypothetical protein [Rhizobiaceae bacterium]